MTSFNNMMITRVKNMTYNRRVQGSSPWGPTIPKLFCGSQFSCLQKKEKLNEN